MSQPTPLSFEPNSVYLLFVMQAGRPHAGVFHHHSGNTGRLAYTDGGIPGPWNSHHAVFLFELDLKQKIETVFTIITTCKVASLKYHEWLPNPHFISSDHFLVDENKWMEGVLCDLDEKWKHKKLVWTHSPDTEPLKFEKLAREYTPSVIRRTQALDMRRELYGAGERHKWGRVLKLYLADSWT